MRSTVLGLGLMGLAVAPVSVLAQMARPEGTALGGVEFRRFTFGAGFAVRSVRQVAVPIGLVVPVGRRFTVDVGGAFASTTLARADGSERTVSKLTDTQVRGSYTFGRDLAVATVLVNLPTGPSRVPAEDFSVLGAVSSSFLPFPVNSYGNGFSVTSGLAVAVPAGGWNLGLAGSVRVNSEYTPYVDANGPFTYSPGLEGRLRAGLDRLVGASRLTLGLTYSTFGTDEFASGATVNGVYRPGKRWIAEGAIVAPIQSGTVTLAAWNYHRASGDSTGTPVGNRENLFSVGGAGTFRLAQAVDLVLAGDGRFLSPESGSGTMGGGSIGLSIAAGKGLNFRPSVRYDLGTIKGGSGSSYTIRGIYLAAFLRGSF